MIKRLRIALTEKTTESSRNSVRVALSIFLVGFLILFVITAVHLSRSGLTLKKELMATVSRGYEEISQGVSLLHSKDFDHAILLFDGAKNTFSEIQNNTWFASSQLGTSKVEDPMFVAGNAVIEAGKSLAQSGILFAQSGKNLADIPKHFFEANQSQYNPETNVSLTAELKKELPALAQSAQEIENANASLAKIPDTLVPEQIREKFRFAKDALTASGEFLSNVFSHMPAILTMLGDDHPHTFLILLQNNDELRPTGGFIGNYMIVQTHNGYITKRELTDIYQADHQLTEVIAPPPEIEYVNHKWFMRDSNYSMDFPTSAKKVMWFLQKETATPVDSVIAIDTSFIRELLDATGPISLSQLGKPLTSGNFSSIISYIVESKLNGRQDPKAILRDFMPAFQAALFKKVDPVTLLPLLSSAVEQKDLLAYSKDPAVEDFFAANGLSGEMQKTPSNEDYLAVAHTSIGGNKSDAYINENVQHDTYLDSDGTITNEVTITRTHTWNDATEAALKGLINSFGFKNISKNVMEILGRSRNLHMLRVYVPKGAKLIASSDSSVETAYDPDVEKTYFSVRMETPVGETRTLKIRYELPFKLDLSIGAKYALKTQKQPGQKNVTFIKRILPGVGVLNYANAPAKGVFDPDGVWTLALPFDHDLSFVSAWGK